MVTRKVKLLVAVSGALLLGVVSRSAPAAVMVPDVTSQAEFIEQADLIESLADVLLNSPGMGWNTVLAGSPSDVPAERRDRPPAPEIQPAPGQSRGACSAPNATSSGASPSSGNPAAPGTLYRMPRPTPQTLLPAEGKTILPTGPPFRLFRPPRVESWRLLLAVVALCLK